MQISRLTISGFKSFGKKTDFCFRQPITAIVGPNGSGKSNITESIRFVLGEQSFKSMRTKEITDLLFRGADSKANQLSVALEFTGVAHLAQLTDSILLKNTLEQDVVEVARVVYADGKNLYKLNNNEVRLKDVTEFMSLCSLGSKSSWHISQGESDRILLSSPEDRRVMIEDALGLKVYHTKILESTRKLERSKENIREAELKRREMAPDLNQLSRQIERIEKVKVFKEDILKIFKTYFLAKSQEILHLEKEAKVHGTVAEIEERKLQLVEVLRAGEQALNSSRSHDTAHLEQSKINEEKVLQTLKQKLYELERQLRDTESAVSYNSLELNKIQTEISQTITDLGQLSQGESERLFKETDVQLLKSYLDDSQSHLNTLNAFEKYQELAENLDTFISRGILVSKDNAKEVSYLKSIQARLETRLATAKSELAKATTLKTELQPQQENLNLQIKIVEENIAKLFAEITEYRLRGSEIERDLEKQKSAFRELENEIEKVRRLEYIHQTEVHKLDERHYELKRVFGSAFDIRNYLHEGDNVEGKTAQDLLDLERQIERLKLKVEDSQVENVEGIQQTYDELSARDKFLVNEIEDLTQSISNLENLIVDLEVRLKADFDKGIGEINEHFNTCVQKLFGGGMGKIYVTEQAKRKAKTENEESEVGEVDDGEVKLGVEVEVELPKKKVKGLHSLSGGERALVSIALTVAILANNPTPFMILDEADATLDEANAHRYGDLLTLMKEKTKLIVVTHNRETMSFADEVYGITLEKSGSSQVLSVSFEDALAYAK
jgi:chromosome segregation protein